MEKIICAIITPIGIGGVSIIRISGNNVFDKITGFIDYIDLKKMSANQIRHAHFVGHNGEFIDEILVSKFCSPYSFTGEDVIEINCHGGMYVANLILRVLLSIDGVYLAQPGEFSKRAFINGKKSLVEIDAIMDIINADNEYKYNVAVSGLNGTTNNLIDELRKKLMDIISVIEVSIDYPEYDDINVIENEKLITELDFFKKDIHDIIIDSQRGKLVANGIDTLIVGLPNVGKSSLFNVLNRTDVAIVTDIEGTTRDLIESKINLGNIQLNLIDSAGIRQTDDPIEKIGIERGLSKIANSQLVIFVLDGSRKILREEYELYEKIKCYPHIVLVNKADVSINEPIPFSNYLNISTTTNIGITEIETVVLKTLDISLLDKKDRLLSLKNENIANLLKVEELVEKSILNASNCVDVDIIEIDLKDAMFHLGEILGINVKEDLLDELFSRFCLGK